MEVLINRCYGGVGLSKEAIALYNQRSATPIKEHFDIYHRRTDPVLHQVVRELGDRANGDFAQLKIVEIPDGVDWVVQDKDGMEEVAERYRIWY